MQHRKKAMCPDTKITGYGQAKGSIPAGGISSMRNRSTLLSISQPLSKIPELKPIL